MDHVTALLFDPHKLSRECFRSVLGGTEIYVSDEAENLEEVLDALYEAVIDLVVINLRNPFEEVANCVRAIRERSAETRIIVIGEVETAIGLEQSGGVGADGYVLHDYSSDGLVDSLRRVHSGEKVYPPAVACALEEAAARHEKEAAAQNRQARAKEARAPDPRVRGLSESEIEKVARILVRRYGLDAEEHAVQSVETLERGGVAHYVGDWKQILSAIQTMKAETPPDYRH